ncbi:MAG TPA: DUF1343 domain-containing protein [Kofleriaceae bacterium]|nr:DUF1343 domain-containing protein [Kofleriaceae bacterium]
MIESGLARIVAGGGGVLRGKRVGLIANPTAVDAELRHAIDLLQPIVDLRALFGPEHGVRGDAQDMIGVDADRDAKSGLPVHSLYGHDAASLSPKLEWLADLDALVFDVQDVGARYYTFVWTMVLAMRACARAKIAFVVLDRPNPIGGALVEGGAIRDGYDSFVGLVSCPNRHGLTAGEIARWRAAEEQLDVELHVIEMRGWTRDMYFEDTGLPWVMPSPNMPTRDTALVYPGMCLVEGTMLSEARGTTRPFELSGAPFLDPYALASELSPLPGAIFRPCTFIPTFHKHAGKPCGAVQIHVTDRAAFRPYLTGVAFLRATRALGGGDFAWRTKAYEFVDRIPAIDLLCGGPEIREGIDAGATLEELALTWKQAEDEFRARRAPHLIYR